MNKTELLNIFSMPLEEVIALGEAARGDYAGKEVSTCAIVNAKSGACKEDCKFCAQSAYSATGVATYPLISIKQLNKSAREAINSGAGCFGIVTSGNKLTDNEFEQLCYFAKNFEDVSKISVSIGNLQTRHFSALKEAGINKIHHNLETSRNFFPSICSTHTYDERVNTILLAKRHGFKVCSGGLFGIGESLEDRVDLALELKNLNVDSIPLNFFVNHHGTHIENAREMTAEEMLKIIALFRLVNPQKNIMVCGGRNKLGDKQNMIFSSGASGIMIGEYLTVKGNSIENDLAIIKNAGYVHTKQSPF
jgi:biotin synthase